MSAGREVKKSEDDAPQHAYNRSWKARRNQQRRLRKLSQGLGARSPGRAGPGFLEANQSTSRMSDWQDSTCRLGNEKTERCTLHLAMRRQLRSLSRAILNGCWG